MFIKYSIKLLAVTGLLFCLTACQEDMIPSGEDQRQADTDLVGKMIEDFSFDLSTGEQDSLNNRLQNHDAVVLYFTMWCTKCDQHMKDMWFNLMDQYPSVDFIAVDYLTSSSVENTRSTQLELGWGSFPTISDHDDALENLLGGTMAITVVIDKNSVVQLNEEYKNGSRLREVLDAL